MTEKPDPTLGVFFSGEKGDLPTFIHAVDDFPHVKIVYLKGPLDNSTSVEMDRFFKKAQKSPAHLDKNVLLDFRKVEHVDSVAIAQLLKAMTVLKNKKRHFGLFNVSEKMRSMLEILFLE